MKNYKNKEHAYSEKLKAGKRTYFFDVKKTHGGDYYLVITESRKNFQEGDPSYKKNKIFLYKEDLNNFVDTLQRTTKYIKAELLPNYDFQQNSEPSYQEDQD